MRQIDRIGASSFGLVAGGWLGADRLRRRRSVGGGNGGEQQHRPKSKRSHRRDDDLQLAALHRPTKRPSPTSKRKPASRSSTSKTSTPTKSSSPRCSRCSNRASRRPQHLRRHRLDGEQDERTRLPAGIRTGGDPELREKPASTTCAAPPYDPGRDFADPWQIGMTGIIVNKPRRRTIHSISDLFDPKYKGKVDMLNELRDTVPLVMKCEGVDVEHATEADWLKAIEKIKGAAESGQIRRFTGNDYSEDLTNGNVVAAIGWSGDAVQLQADNPNIEWRMPDEGCILWSDNMVIPVGAPNPTAAEAWIELRLRPGEPGPDRGLRQLRQPGRRDERSPAERRTGNRGKQTDLPARLVHQEVLDPALADRRRRTEHQPGLQRGAERLVRWPG